jgi:hypothetical protein
MSDVKDNIKKQSTWMRALYMLLFFAFYTLAEIVLFVVIIFQFLLKLLTGDTNDRLRKLSQCIATYVYQILQFLSFNSDSHPYPFGAWPKGEPKSTQKAVASDAGEASK